MHYAVLFGILTFQAMPFAMKPNLHVFFLIVFNFFNLYFFKCQLDFLK